MYIMYCENCKYFNGDFESPECAFQDRLPSDQLDDFVDKLMVCDCPFMADKKEEK